MKPHEASFEYLQQEIMSISDSFDREYFLDELIKLSESKRDRLIVLLKELNKLGFSNSFVWALQDITNNGDKGGTANISFTESLLNLGNRMPEVAEELKDEKYADIFDVMHKKPEVAKDFFQSLGFLFIQYVISHIEEGNKKSDILRSWKLFAVNEKGQPICEIRDINVFV